MWLTSKTGHFFRSKFAYPKKGSFLLQIFRKQIVKKTVGVITIPVVTGIPGRGVDPKFFFPFFLRETIILRSVQPFWWSKKSVVFCNFELTNLLRLGIVGRFVLFWGDEWMFFFSR